MTALAKARARTSDLAGARALQTELRARNETTQFERAVIALDLGEREVAFSELRRIAESGRFPLVGIDHNPLMDPFRKDPRFERLAAVVHREQALDSPL